MTTPVRPMPVAELARALGVDRATLWRALRSDPAAPAPDTRDDQDRPLYRPGPVTAWWPNRRRRGRPRSLMYDLYDYRSMGDEQLRRHAAEALASAAAEGTHDTPAGTPLDMAAAAPCRYLTHELRTAILERCAEARAADERATALSHADWDTQTAVYGLLGPGLDDPYWADPQAEAQYRAYRGEVERLVGKWIGPLPEAGSA